MPHGRLALLEHERAVAAGAMSRYRLACAFATVHGKARHGLFTVTRVSLDRVVVQGVDVSNYVRPAEPATAGADRSGFATPRR